MHVYRIAQKIWTVAEIEGTIEIEGFSMSPAPNDNDGAPAAWIAIRDQDGPDFSAAFNAQRAALVKTVDALAVVTQCSFSLIAASLSIARLTGNPEGIVYLRQLRPRKTVGMTVWKKGQVDDVKRLIEIENPGALRYFREAINASTASARLAMLVITAEALAGQGKVAGKCQQCEFEYSYGGTNRETLAAVLGTVAYQHLYKGKTGSLRNRLLHGSAIDENSAAEVSVLAYDSILQHLEKRLGLESIETITEAPRTFQNFEWLGLFLKCGDGVLPELPQLERGWQQFGAPVDQPTEY